MYILILFLPLLSFFFCFFFGFFFGRYLSIFFSVFAQLLGLFLTFLCFYEIVLSKSVLLLYFILDFILIYLI